MVQLEINRPNGQTEMVDVTARFPAMTDKVFATIRFETAKAGRGHVVRAIETALVSNYPELAKAYNNVVNEGCDGFVPDMTQHPKYKEWTVTKEYK